MNKKHEIGIVLLVLAAGLCLRIWSALTFWNWVDAQFPGAWERSRSVFSQDGSQYVKYASEASENDRSKPSWQTKPYYRPPLASYYFSRLIRMCRFNRQAVSAVQSLLALAAYGLIYLIGRRFFSPLISLFGLAVLMLHPVCIFFDTSFEDSSPALLLLGCTLLLFVKPLKRQWLGWLLAGFLMGLTLLCRPNLNMIFFCLISYVLLRYKKGSMRPALLFTFAMLIVVSIPILHNYRASGRFSFIVTTAGENLFWGNNRHPYYLIDMQGFSGIPQVDQGSPERLLKTMLAREYGAKNSDEMYRKAFAGYAGEHPWRFAAGLGKKALRHISNYEIPRNGNFYFLRPSSPLFSLPLVPYSLLFAFMLFGLRERREIGQKWMVLLAPCAAIIVSEVIFFNASRYRTMAIPFIVLPAAAGFFAYVNNLRFRRWRPAIAETLVAAAMLILGYAAVPQIEQQRYLSVDHYKAALEELYPGRDRSLGIANVGRYLGHLSASLSLDPDNLNSFCLYEKYKIVTGRFEEAKSDIARRSGRCAEDDPLCSDVCRFADSLCTMMSNVKPGGRDNR